MVKFSLPDTLKYFFLLQLATPSNSGSKAILQAVGLTQNPWGLIYLLLIIFF